LIVFILLLFILLIYPSVAIFVFAMVYLVWGIIENIYLFVNREKLKQTEQEIKEEFQNPKF